MRPRHFQNNEQIQKENEIKIAQGKKDEKSPTEKIGFFYTIPKLLSEGNVTINTNFNMRVSK